MERKIKMKRKWLFIILGIFLLFTLAACNNEEASHELPELVEVTIQLPDDMKVNEATSLSALVVQGEEKVNDAKDVTFEIWMEGMPEEDHEKIIATFEKDGIYSISYTFNEAGTYHAIAHINARDMHVMPKITFEVTK
jgi:ABC-type glycerol-3-phosphate transport system substrate-binding protein